jgi:hypothetical protein
LGDSPPTEDRVPTYDFELKPIFGADRLKKLGSDAAPGEAEMSLALCLRYIEDHVNQNEVSGEGWRIFKEVDQPLKSTIDFLKANVSPKRFTDGLPKLGAVYHAEEIEIALDGQMQDLSAANVAKAVEKLADGGRYLVVAVEKTYTKGYWASIGIVAGKNAWTVFAPYNGLFKTTKSAEVASALMDHMKGRNFAKKVDAFLVLKVSHIPGDILTPRFAKAVAGTKAALNEFTTQALNDDVARNWFGKDFTRFADHSQLSADGKVLKAHMTDMKAHDFLDLMVKAMGSTWAVPADVGKMYDAATNGAELKAHVAKTLKNGDELYKLFVLTTQNMLTDYVLKLLQEAKVGQGKAGQIAATSIDPRIKDKDAERWWFDLEITKAKAKVTHHITFASKLDANFPKPFIVRITIPRELNRGSKAVTCLPVTTALTLG